MPLLNIITEYWYLFIDMAAILVLLWVIDRCYDKQNSIFVDSEFNKEEKWKP